jgi:starch phosphorylase
VARGPPPTARRPGQGRRYLSAEYLLGRQLDNNLLASGLTEIATEAMAACGIDIDDLRAQEVEPGLGNGGLGRLAACFIDSLATMGVPNIGYGIRYEYGIFRQTFVDGQQVEQPDAWLTLGSPWEFPHPEAARRISFGGHTETYDDAGVTRSRWVPGWDVLAVPYNYMVPGYLNGRVNTLRLWSAKATDSFDLRVFNSGDYEEAVRARPSPRTSPRCSTPRTPRRRARSCVCSSSTSSSRHPSATSWSTPSRRTSTSTSSPTVSSSSSTTPTR